MAIVTKKIVKVNRVNVKSSYWIYSNVPEPKWEWIAKEKNIFTTTKAVVGQSRAEVEAEALADGAKTVTSSPLGGGLWQGDYTLERTEVVSNAY